MKTAQIKNCNFEMYFAKDCLFSWVALAGNIYRFDRSSVILWVWMFFTCTICKPNSFKVFKKKTQNSKRMQGLIARISDKCFGKWKINLKFSTFLKAVKSWCISKPKPSGLDIQMFVCFIFLNIKLKYNPGKYIVL